MACSCREPLCSYFSPSAQTLRCQIADAFQSSPHGPGGVGAVGSEPEPEPEGGEEAGVFPLMLLGPHGAAADSFPVAAHGFAELGQVMRRRPIDTLLIIGNNHRQPGVALSDARWQTPLGTLEPEPELIAQLAAGASIAVRNADHSREHSIENQLPLLQHLAALTSPSAPQPRLVALSVGYRAFGSAEEAAELAKAIGAVLMSSEGRASPWAATTAIVATTDYTHAGPGYRELPPGEEPAGGWASAAGQEALIGYAKARDAPVLDAITGGGGASAVVAAGKATSMCGLWSAALAVELSSVLGLGRRRLLKYAVSAEVSPHPSGCVTGFAVRILLLVLRWRRHARG
eukprot:COSAG04_NODE_770_length_10444_cov_6.484872_7_plen_345_part_00